MILYVVIYSIILFALAACVCAFAYVYVYVQRKKMAERIRQSRVISAGEKAFLNVLGQSENVAFLIAEIDTKRVAFCSPNIVKILGVEPEELYDEAGCLKRTMDKVTLRNFEREYRRWDRRGVFVFEFGYNKDRIAHLEVICAEWEGQQYSLFVFSDFTETAQERERMQTELDEALHLASEKGSFLSNMSHEIRTPMNGIIGMMSLAKMNINDTERVLSYLEKAGYLATFLVGMINDILDISKMESGRMQLYNENFDIFKFADKINNMFSSTMQSKGINYKVELLDFTARILVGDELRLTQVITNLVSNAQKFTPVGGYVTVTFKQLDILDTSMQLMIRVRDTGKGIAPEAIHKIMKPFVQEEASTSHKYGGTGLGLAITDNFIKLMGGNITIDSVVGKGSDFSVFLSLPIADVEQDVTKPVDYADSGAVDEYDYNGKKILMAEDNEINAEIAIEILESEGATVTLAHDGQECVDIFLEQPEGTFDLLLVDIQMPRMNGRDAARAIRKSGKADATDVPIIALSADAFVEDMVNSKNAGMDGHVTKPIDFEELRKRIGEIVAQKKGGRNQ